MNTNKGRRSISMKRLITFLAAIFFIAFVSASSTAVRAQEDKARLLKQLEEDSDRFSKSLNQAVDQSKINGTNTEDQINGYVKQFEDACDRLKKDYDKSQDTRISAREVLQRAKTINKFMKKYPLTNTAQTDWGTVRNDINRIAVAHNMKAVF
jgi:uncharacterized membrane protein YvbJ